jgi:hypothetical protein
MHPISLHGNYPPSGDRNVCRPLLSLLPRLRYSQPRRQSISTICRRSWRA